MMGPAVASRRDLVAGSLIVLSLALLFVLGSPGLALIVTFVPGLFAAWLVFIYLRSRPLPEAKHFLPIYSLSLAVQFLHFAEEYVAGFPSLFGPLYWGAPIGDDLFVIFNMASYAVFLLASVAVAFASIRPLLIPVLFFILYGVAGTAIAHLMWVIAGGQYFPGLYTSLLYWVLAPILLRRVGLSWREVTLVCVCFGALLIVTAGLTMNPAILSNSIRQS